MTSYPISYPVTEAVSYKPARALLGGASRAPAPAFTFSFAGVSSMPAGTSFSRASPATYFDSSGNLQTAATNVPRFTYDFFSNKAIGLLPEGPTTNSIRNNSMQGVVAGTPGTLPTNWSIAFNSTGLSSQVVGSGKQKNIDYVDLRIFGTTAAAGEIQIFFEATNNIASGNGASWAISTFNQLVGGSATNLSYLVQDVDMRSAANADLGFVGNGNNLSPSNVSPASWLRFADRFVTTNASTGFVAPAYRMGVNGPGSAVDITIRIGMPQFEAGLFATSVIRTTNAAVSRAADVPLFTGAAATLLASSTKSVVARIGNAPSSNYAIIGAASANYPGFGFISPNYSTSNGFGVNQLNVAPTTGTYLNLVGLSNGGASRLLTNNGGTSRGGTTASDSANIALGTTFGTDGAQNYPFSGGIAQIDLYNVALTQSQLEAKTNPVETTAWGDSLTAGTGSSSPTTNYGYVGYLSALTQQVTNPQGVGGQTSSQIAARMLADTYHTNDNVVLEAGRNNVGNAPASIVADIQSMIDHLAPGNTQYVILSVINATAENSAATGPNLTNYNNILAINAALAAAFPGHYLDVRSAIVTASGGANDAPPASWMYQGSVHPNDAGYQVMATQIQTFGHNNGWIGF
jgi:lysophospholipase L1-like esterase